MWVSPIGAQGTSTGGARAAYGTKDVDSHTMIHPGMWIITDQYDEWVHAYCPASQRPPTVMPSVP